LIERFYDPVSGSIEFEGIDIKALNVHSLREHIGYVGQGMMFCCFDLHFISTVVHSSLFSLFLSFQEPVLFNDTIANNIAYGYSAANRHDVEKAASLANAHDFIASLPDGYDTLIGERGTQLSGKVSNHSVKPYHVLHCLMPNLHVMLGKRRAKATYCDSPSFSQEPQNLDIRRGHVGA